MPVLRLFTKYLCLLILSFVITGLCLSSTTKAEDDFSEIYLNDAQKAKTFFTETNNQTLLNGSIIVQEQEDTTLHSDIIPHHKLFFGNVSVYEDKTSFSTINSGDDLGVKISGHKGLLNYSAGIYNIKKAGGWASINPLHSFPKVGKLEIGSGLFTNSLGLENEKDQQNSFNVFAGYKFKRFSTRGEFIRKYYAYYDDKYYDSWRFSNKFDLTKNLKLKAGYKEFEETKSFVNDFGVEYSINNVKLEFEGSIIKYQQKENLDSKRFGIKTKYLF